VKRVITLLPAVTEIVAALGDQRVLVGISHECDYPPSVQHLPRVTTTPIDSGASSASIDAEVHRLRQSGKPVIAIDADQLRRLAPDLIITQELCEVCAVSQGQVRRLAATMRPRPQVLALAAHDLEGIWRDIVNVGAALSMEDEAEELLLGLQSRLERLRALSLAHRSRVLCIEWLDPLYLAGHWVPQLVHAAGGEDVGAVAGSHSEPGEWAALARSAPDCILIMLCGFGIGRSRAELELLTNPDALELIGRVPTWILDGNAYTSRPGPRIVDGASRIRSALRDQSMPGVERWQPAGVC
jgi:iron complex transport system substrate-binding protein